MTPPGSPPAPRLPMPFTPDDTAPEGTEDETGRPAARLALRPHAGSPPCRLPTGLRGLQRPEHPPPNRKPTGVQ